MVAKHDNPSGVSDDASDRIRTCLTQKFDELGAGGDFGYSETDL